MNIYYEFKPTFLYIKQHTITGKLYFGKTTRNPEKYKGSGLHWKRHYLKHGKDNIITLWYCLYTDKNSLIESATSFSKLWNIVESDDWLNLIEENGLDGAPSGLIMSEEIKNKISNSKKGKKNPKISGKNHYHYGKALSVERKKQNSISSSGKNNPMHGKISAFKGKQHTEEFKNKLSLKFKNKKRSIDEKNNMSIGCKKSYSNGRIANCAKQITVNGVTFESLEKAKKSTGLSRYKLLLLIK